MSLTVDLRPNERLIIDGAWVRNGNVFSSLTVTPATKFLSEDDIIKESEANTSCKRLYVLIQIMYLADDPFEAETEFMRLASEVIATTPSMSRYIALVHACISEGQFRKALKFMRELIAYEAMLLEQVLGSLQNDDQVRH